MTVHTLGRLQKCSKTKRPRPLFRNKLSETQGQGCERLCQLGTHRASSHDNHPPGIFSTTRQPSDPYMCIYIYTHRITECILLPSLYVGTRARPSNLIRGKNTARWTKQHKIKQANTRTNTFVGATRAPLSLFHAAP